MNLKNFFTASFCIVGLGSPLSAQTKPNIVFILADDMGWGDISANGNSIIETPVLNNLAKESMSFERFYVCPLCAPTRSEILTGRYFLRTGVSSVTSGYENMRGNETTLAEILKQNGYKTGIFGKWHNGAYFEHHPNRQGFDEFVGFCVGHLGYYFDAIYQHNDIEIKSEGYTTNFFTDRALQFIEDNKKQQFFCYLPYLVPHSPFQVPEKYFQKYKSKGLDNELATVYGMVDNMDENIGRVISKIEELGLTKNTIFIFLSDNGPNTFRYNGELKGKKGSVDEGGIITPFYISWEGKIKPGKNSQLAQSIDLLPTLMALCNINYETNFPIDGKNLSNIIHGREKEFDRNIYSRQANQSLEICNGSVRNRRFKLVVSQKDTSLFDLSVDPSQMNDISKVNKIITSQLSLAYRKWEREMVKSYKSETKIRAGFVDEKRINLPVQDATLSGKVNFSSIHPNQSHTVNWVQNNDSIYWNLEMINSGKYRVELQYGCPVSEVGSKFQLSTNSKKQIFTISQPFDSKELPNLDYVKRSESEERTWAWMEVAIVKLEAGELTFGLKLLEKQKENAGIIKAIRLIKI